MPRRGALAVIAAAALALALAGCGGKAEPTGTLSAFPAHAVDASGAAVEVAQAPTRIVSADPGATAILRDLGLGTAIVEATPATAAAQAGRSATALVVVPLAMDETALAQVRAATDAPVFRYGAVPLDRAPVVVAQLGLAVGRGADAASIAQRLDDGLAGVRRAAAAATPVRTLIEGPGFTALGPASAAGADVAAAGGVNVVPGDQQLEISAIGALDVAAWVALDPGGSSLTRLRSYRELASTPAIRDGRWLAIPRDGFPIDAALPQVLRQLVDDLHAPPVTTG